MKFDVMLVSSSPAELRSLKEMLDPELFKYVIADSYKQAVTLLCRGCFDAIICDEYLTDGSWKDLVGQVAEKPERPALIVVTTGIEEYDREIALQLGAYELLARPVEGSALVNTLYGACCLACTGQTAGAAAGGA
jgi:DNA-binding response OmpR family regulator